MTQINDDYYIVKPVIYNDDTFKKYILSRYKKATKQHILPFLNKKIKSTDQSTVNKYDSLLDINDGHITILRVLKHRPPTVVIHIPWKCPTEIKEIDEIKAIFVENEIYFDFILNQPPIFDFNTKSMRIIFE
jgi:hypothetical protein